MADYMIRYKKLKIGTQRREGLNPYRIGLSILLNRLLWDLAPMSWFHRRHLSALKNKYTNQKAVICCNGPSLVDTDFSLLDDVYTFGLNKINLLFQEHQFRPSSIISVNPLVLEQNAHFFSTTDIPLFLDQAARKFGVKTTRNTTFLHSCDYPHFARDVSVSLFQGYTVTYVALQLAYHMGFRKVALIGCDHNYEETGFPNSAALSSGSSTNHFSENYFKEGQPWQYPDLESSEFYYYIARRYFEDDGRSIVNASVSGNLEVFPYLSLENFLKDG